MPPRGQQGFHPPEFMLETFFDGRVKGWGFMHTRFGRLARQFRIEAAGQWDRDARTLRLDEDYSFDDGHRDRLEWRIVKQSDARYRGSEKRLDGTAEGEQSGNRFRWRYVRDVPQGDGKSRRLTFDDCFHLQQPDVMLARASVSRFGIEVAVITVAYLKS